MEQNEFELSGPVHFSSEFHLSVSGQFFDPVPTHPPPTLIIGVDRAWRVAFLNEAASTALGQPAEAAKGMGLWEVIPPTKVAPIESTLRDAMQRREMCRLEYRLDKTTPWYEVQAYPTSDGLVILIADITSQKAREQVQRQAADQKRALELARVGTWTWDAHSRTLHWSNVMQMIHGWAPNTFDGRPESAMHLVPREDQEQILQAIHHTLETGADFHIQYRQRLEDQSIRWMESKGQLIRDEHHRPLRLTGTCMEITARKAAEHALRESEKRFRAIFDQAAVGIGVLSLDGQFIEMNSRYCEIVGYSREQLRAMDDVIATLTYPEDLTSSKAEFHKLASGQCGSYQLEKRYIRSDGRIAWVKLAMSALRDEADQPQQIIGVAEDITERKQAEQALRDSEQRARLQADNLAAIMDSVPAMVWIAHDAEARHITGSRRAYEIMRMPVGTNLSTNRPKPERPAHFKVYHHGKELSPEQMPVQRAAQGEEVYNYEAVIKFNDGQQYFLFGHAVPLHNELGQPRGAVAAFVDLTEQHRLMDQLQQLNRSLEQRIGERTAELEHRANQLRHLAGELSRAEQRERRKLAQLLHDHLQQLLVGAKLQVKALERLGEAPVAHAAHQAAQLLDQAIHDSRSLSHELSPPIIDQKGLAAALHWLASLKEEKHSLLVHVDADEAANPESEDVRVLLFQAVRELLLNVVKHADTDEAWVRMRRNGEDEVEVEVWDRGRGFDLSAMDTQTDTGSFGLFSLQERLAWWGGALKVESQPGEGTHVTLCAPRYKVKQLPSTDATSPRHTAELTTEAPASPTIAPPEASNHKTSTQPLRVLLVDDHAVVRQSLAHLLHSQEHCEVVGEAANGEQALALRRRSSRTSWCWTRPCRSWMAFKRRVGCARNCPMFISSA